MIPKMFSVILFTFCGISLLPDYTRARPGRHFKELILHERIVPFDDSMDGEDYYGNFDEDRKDLLSFDSAAATTVQAPPDSRKDTPPYAGTSHQQSSLKETVTKFPSTTENASQELKTTKQFRKWSDGDYGDDGDDAEGEEADDDSVADEEANQITMKDVTATVADAAETDIDNDEKSKDKDEIPKFHDPCRYVYCRMGRVCKVSPDGKGRCVCADADHCHGNSKRVCGTDGEFYPSHCELHRSACLKGSHISTDHSMKSCSGKKSGHSYSSPSEILSPASEGDLGDDKEVSKLPPPSSSSVSPCTRKELDKLISTLITFHCSWLGKNSNCTEKQIDRRYAFSSMFSYYDRNGDKVLDSVELTNAELHEHLMKNSLLCHFTDLLRSNVDSDMDGRLSSEEFFTAFGVSLATLDDNLKVYMTSVTVGNSVELKCEVKGIDRIVWKRKGHSLEGAVDKQIRVFDDGSLYIGDLRLDHMGNYTCQDRMSNDVIQTHVLLVQTLPQVEVHPLAQIHLSGSTVTLKCRADGVPRPEVTWEKNEWPLQATVDSQQRYLFLHNSTVLEIKSADYKYDTGAYKCKAKNSAGTSDQVAAVFVENSATSKHSSYMKQSELFVIFHDRGYTVYEVGHCHMEHQVTKDFRGFKISPEQKETVDTLCPANDSCSWAGALVVKNKFIYITQPKLNRVVVLETDRSNPVEVMVVDGFPFKLDYMEQLDEVWVTCLKDGNSKDLEKSIFIIRQASSEHPHFASRFLPKEDGLGEVTGVFLPASNSLKHSFDYGYVTRGSKMALHKLDLASATYAKIINLSEYSCLPRSAQFIPIGGMVLVGCLAHESETKPSFHLLLDYITDGLLERLEVNGDSFLSPDGRSIVTVGDHGNTVFVFKATDDGTFRHVFDEYTQLHLDDVAFFPSESGFDFDAFLSSADQPSILHLDLESGRVSITEGLGEALPASHWPAVNHRRIIVSGGPFSEHLMTSSKTSAVVIDGRRRRIQCEWKDVINGNVIVSLQENHRD